MGAIFRIRCTACANWADFDATFEGCRRPCSSCGELIFVSRDPEKVRDPPPTALEACPCGRRRKDEGGGVFFELVSRHRQHEGTSPLATFFLLFAGIHFTGGSSETIEFSFFGWVCESCRRRAVWCRRWCALRWIFVPVVGLVAPAALVFHAYFVQGIRNRQVLFDSLFGFGVFLFFLTALLAGLPASRIILGLLSRPLRAAVKCGRVAKVRLHPELPQGG